MVGRKRVFGDRRNTTDAQRARMSGARSALDTRLAQFDGEHGAIHGHCRCAPFFIVDPTVWDGRFGTLLHALNLIAYDEWNVLILAGDDKTAQLCDLPVHPGAIPGLNVKMTETLGRLNGEFAAAGDDTARMTVRQKLLEYVEFCKAGVVDILTADQD